MNVLQVCDHLGWEGSRMHGVKRLFSWMIPAFDPERFNENCVWIDGRRHLLPAVGFVRRPQPFDATCQPHLGVVET